MEPSETPARTLADLPIGSRARILRVRGNPEILRRLMDMGLVRGSELLVIRNAPLEDPLEIEVKGYRLALRRSEAAQVLVALPGAAEDPE